MNYKSFNQLSRLFRPKQKTENTETVQCPTLSVFNYKTFSTRRTAYFRRKTSLNLVTVFIDV
jgi:hypothetical protein